MDLTVLQLNEQADLLLKGKDWAQAEHSLQRAERLLLEISTPSDEEWALTLYNWGLFRMKIEDWRGAIEAFDKSLLMNDQSTSRNIHIQLSLAQIYSKKTCHALALDHAFSALKLASDGIQDLGEIYLLIARQFKCLRRDKEAVQYLNQGLSYCKQHSPSSCSLKELEELALLLKPQKPKQNFRLVSENSKRRDLTKIYTIVRPGNTPKTVLRPANSTNVPATGENKRKPPRPHTQFRENRLCKLKKESEPPTLPRISSIPPRGYYAEMNEFLNELTCDIQAEAASNELHRSLRLHQQFNKKPPITRSRSNLHSRNPKTTKNPRTGYSFKNNWKQLEKLYKQPMFKRKKTTKVGAIPSEKPTEKNPKTEEATEKERLIDPVYVQAQLRGYLTRMRLSQRIKAATTIQSHVRALLVRAKICIWHSAAKKIQGAFRNRVEVVSPRYVAPRIKSRHCVLL